MCADQLTRERHRRKAFFNFSKNSGCSSTPMDNTHEINQRGYTAACGPKKALTDTLFLALSVKRRRRFCFPPPIGMNVVLETVICGRNTSPVG